MSVTQSNPPTSTNQQSKPRFAIGHLALEANDVAQLTRFYTAIGMRLVVEMDRFTILELRGGTHLIVQPGQPGQTSLDLIVDDIDETRQVLIDAGATSSEIRRGSPHDRFTATDPEGNALTIHSNHAIGPV